LLAAVPTPDVPGAPKVFVPATWKAGKRAIFTAVVCAN
jgi:hypothetical protein